MTEIPTPDDLARWAAEHHGWTPEDYPDSGEFCVECGEHMPCPTTRLLALVAAQAEQNAEHKWQLASAANAAFEAEQLPRELAAEPMVIAAVERAERAEAELSALRATDEYQRWARAVVERDAAREAVARVRALCDRADFEHAAFAASLGTGAPPTGEVWVRAVDVAGALEGGAAR